MAMGMLTFFDSGSRRTGGGMRAGYDLTAKSGYLWLDGHSFTGEESRRLAAICFCGFGSHRSEGICCDS